MRVLLTSDSGLGNDVVRDALARGGHEVEEPVTAGAGALLAASNWTADAVVAVMWQKRPPKQRFDAVLVEVGIALGRGIPVLLLTRRELALPALAGVPRIDVNVEAGFIEDSLLHTQINLFLRGVQTQAPRKPPASTARPIAPSPVLTTAHGEALEFETRVGEVLRAAGTEVIPEGQVVPGEGRADYAIYLPADQSDLGVVLVEAKRFGNEKEQPPRLRRAAQLLSQQVVNAHAGLGLLVYEGKEVRLPPTPLVVAMSLSELAGRLNNVPLAEVLRQARNKAIHAL
jgi:hypothetical protein